MVLNRRGRGRERWGERGGGRERERERGEERDIHIKSYHSQSSFTVHNFIMVMTTLQKSIAFYGNP